MSRYQFETKYLFIDGAYFQKGLRDLSEEFYNGATIEIDYNRVRCDFDKVFYYDSIFEEQRSDESESQNQERVRREQDLLNNIRATDGFHVYKGVKVSEKKHREQKQVDILISVHMLRHAFHKTMQRACLLSGDLDFKPLVDALVELGTHVTLWHFADNTSDDLRYAADSHGKLDIETIHSWTTKSFQKLHTIPTGHGDFDKKTQGYSFLRTIETTNKRVVEIYSGSEGFLAINKNDEDTHWYHWKYRDEAKLLKFLNDKGIID